MSTVNKFQKGFLWGAATSAYQVEGNINNNDWSQSQKLATASRACDHYNRYETDFLLAKELHHNAHRLSVEWSRIEPEKGNWDLKEIDHYRNVLNNLKTKGFETFVTLNHFTNPVWFSEQGGWSSNDSINLFSEFAKKMASEFGDLVDFWVTVNEPNVYTYMSYLKSKWPPFERSYIKGFKVYRNLLKAHNAAYESIHDEVGDARVGFALNIGWKEGLLLGMFYNLVNVSFPFFMTKSDYIGLNHYFYWPSSKSVVQKMNHTDKGWLVYPKAIYLVLMMLKKYNLPIYITENGISDRQDNMRSHYIRNYLKEVLYAINDGADVKGYLYWSLLDNYEWPVDKSETGYESKFGLVEVDFADPDLPRKIRPSAYVYAKICETNSLDT